MCICVCVFDIFVPTAALIDEPPRLLETIPFGHPYQPVHNIKAGEVLRGDNILMPSDKLVGPVFARPFSTNIAGKYTNIIVIRR